MSTASGNGRPAITRNSSTLSKTAESLPPSTTTGMIFLRSSPSTEERQIASRACIQLMFPRSVLISPLWAIIRYGWARGHDGKVLVEKRWCTSASAESTRGSVTSGNIPSIWSAESMPL